MTVPDIPRSPVGDRQPLVQVVTLRFDGFVFHQLLDEDGNALAELSSVGALSLAMELIQAAGTAVVRPASGIATGGRVEPGGGQ